MADTINITKENIRYIRDAFSHFFPEDTVYSADSSFKLSDFYWKGRKDFIDFVYRQTGVVIKSDKDIEHIKMAEQVFEKITFESGKDEGPTESYLPDKAAREMQEAERQKREAELKSTTEQAKAGVAASIKRKQELYEKQQSLEKTKRTFEEKIRVQQEIKESLKNKKIYAKVEIAKEAPIPDENTQKFIEQAKKYPTSFEKDLAEKLKSQISSSPNNGLSAEEAKMIADKTAYDTVSAVNNPLAQYSANTQAAILEALAKDSSILGKTVSIENAILIKQAASELAYFENSTQLSKNILSSINPNLATTVFGTGPENLRVVFSDHPTNQTHEIDLAKLNSGYTDLLSSQSDAINNIGSFGGDQLKSALLGQARTFLDSQIAKLPADSLISGIYNSQFGQQVLSFAGLTESVPLGDTFFGGIILKVPGASAFFEGLGGSLGIDFGISAAVPAAEIASTTIAATEGTAIVGAATMAGVETGITAVGGAAIGVETGAAVGTAVGTGTGVATGTATGAATGGILGLAGGPLAIVTAAIGAVVGWIGSKIPWHKVKKALPWVLGGIVGFGTFSIAGPLLGVVVGLGTYGLLAAGTGGAGLGAAAVGGAIALLLARIGKAFAFTVAKPVIAFFIGFPILIVIILFIINSGAYVVPPTTMGFGSNPYIQVEKIPSPAGPFENFNLPLSIKYSIKVTAKKGPLTNVVITDSCQVITESGTRECSPELPADIPSEISPSSPYTFSYNSNYSGDGYKDSLVVNTLTVSADTIDGFQQAITTASIRIGDPPDSCPNDSWPVAGDGGINRVTQGPSSPPGCSHNGYDNAIDIGVSGKTIVAVNSGVVTVGQDSCIGKYIKIASACGTTEFSVLYAHLGVVGVKDGQTVTLGQALGISDNTGSCTTGPHLHFEFRTASIPIVQKPYLKRDIPIMCCTIRSCNP